MHELAPFLIRYLHGSAGIEEIHSDIERWHSEPILNAPELHEFLGLWPSEYMVFVEHEWKFVRYLDHLKNIKNDDPSWRENGLKPKGH